MKKNYQQLTEEDREKLYLMLQAGANVTQISRALGRDRSTIYREVYRNASPEYQHYLPHRAQSRAESR